MLKKLMLTAAIGALSVSGAYAQANPPASNPPAQAAPATTSPKFIAAQSADQWVFSKFKGTDVLGPDDAHIGDVVDLLFDKSGKVDALIVGVGGFLGIGEKNVAIDLSGFQVVPASTGSKTTTGAASSSSNDPTNVKLKVSWTKDQLKQAADFQYYKAPAATTGMAPRTAPAPAPVPAQK
jgi:PRC-barrel domain